MTFIEQERQRAVALRDDFFNDPGGTIFKGKEREFVLRNPLLNLMPEIRDAAVEYFNTYDIPFWNSGEKREIDDNRPSGHLLSSQIACVNHLFFLRNNEAIASAVLKGIDRNVKTALVMNGGFVEFEIIGQANYLKEKSHSRGANSTSVDAVMLAEMRNGQRKLFFIEWKYVEEYYKYKKELYIGKSGETRKKIYSQFLEMEDCPIKKVNKEGLYTEPFYQLMRQTLLAKEMAKANEYGASDYVHLHLIPKGNNELKNQNPTKGKLKGETLEEIWTSILKEPAKYKTVDPKDFLEPARSYSEAISIIKYLEDRYWT